MRCRRARRIDWGLRRAPSNTLRPLYQSKICTIQSHSASPHTSPLFYSINHHPITLTRRLKSRKSDGPTTISANLIIVTLNFQKQNVGEPPMIRQSLLRCLKNNVFEARYGPVTDAASISVFDRIYSENQPLKEAIQTISGVSCRIVKIWLFSSVSPRKRQVSTRRLKLSSVLKVKSEWTCFR